MGRKTHKVEDSHSDDIVIDLLVRHAQVPGSDELLERFARTYSGRPAGFVAVATEVAPEAVPVPEPVMDFGDADSPAFEVPAEEFQSLHDVVVAAGDDSDNDYDAPGATVSMEAIDSIPELEEVSETMNFDADQVAAMIEDESLADEAVDGDADGDADGDENATVMMGAVEDPASGGESGGQKDGGRNRKKKRRHR